jgi:4a-hydroxytetrahydrobiopterin dehydratase
MTTLSDQEIDQRLAEVEWEREDDQIARELKFADFAEAMSFANRVAEVAEELDHHPDILVHGWNRVRLSVTTHSEGGLTAGDFELARRVDALG